MVPYVRIAVLFVVLIPTFIVVVILWNFDALNEGGPLIVVFLVPALGWCGTHLMKMVQTPREQTQNELESDPPPMYEKVMLDPPPYEFLYTGKPVSSTPTSLPTCSSAADCVLSSDKQCLRHVPQCSTELERGDDEMSPSVSERMCYESSVNIVFEKEPLVNQRDKESAKKTVRFAPETFDPDLPSYHEAITVSPQT